MATSSLLDHKNKTLLWNALQSSVTFNEFSPNYITKQEWFLESVNKFHSEYFGSLENSNNKSYDELKIINKRILKYLINDIKNYKDPVLKEYSFNTDLSAYNIDESLNIGAVELTDEAFGRNYDTTNKTEKNRNDEINNRFTERQKEYEMMNTPNIPLNTPTFNIKTKTFGHNTDDIKDRFAERQKEYERMNTALIPSNTPLFNIKIGEDEQEDNYEENPRSPIMVQSTSVVNNNHNNNYNHADNDGKYDIDSIINRINDIVRNLEIKQDIMVKNQDIMIKLIDQLNNQLTDNKKILI